MRNLCFLLTLVATLLLPGRLIAAALPQDEKLITGQLDNGLRGNDSNLLIVFYVQIMPDDFVMQLHRF